MLHRNNLDDKRFNEITQTARMKISEYSPQWSDLNTHDPGVMLIELFAWLTEQQRFYMDQNEEASSFFPLLGIAMRCVSAAETEVELPGGFEQRSIPADTPLFAENVRFETVEDIVYDGTPMVVRVVQRETLQTPVILGYAHGYPGESFTADAKGQTILDFSISVANEPFMMTDSFRASRPEDKHYMLCRETGEIIFGDGIHGGLAYGEVVINRMVITRGQEGNIAQNRITEFCGLPVIQRAAAKGGFPRETETEALQRFNTGRRQAVTAEDVEELVLETPDIQVSRVCAFCSDELPQLGAPRVITVVVKLSDGGLTDTTAQKIRLHLEPYRLVCRDFYVIEAKSARVSLNLELSAGPHGAKFEESLEISVKERFMKLYGDFGAVLRESEIRSFVAGMPEVLEVRHCAFRVYGNAKLSVGGDITLAQDTLADLYEVSVRVLAG